MEDNDEGYVRVAGRTTEQRRRRRAALVLGSLVAFLVLALAVALLWNQRSGDAGRAPAAPAATCTPPPAPARVSVNVYNATDRAGLAARAATGMKAQGFAVAAVKNDPLERTVKGPAEVRHGPAGAAAAAVVAARVPGAKLVADRRTDAGVDLVLGSAFTTVSKTPATPAPVC
ncbi:LytR C-terminal domain-containing protein [Agilicoccus flavus]|uniref:LytR C-terminal domain-containing protein n=1 Tax=Agilicoccus flavus TaxID=2775968 RepID=UPI001CF64D89|nr:LytR C-terminal domain-containing protein [Agilicoccus flavus]